MNTSDALSNYQLGEIHKIEPIHIGYIHKTHTVEASTGKYILQRVSPIFKPEVMEDISAALNHLKKYGLETMEIVPTKTKKLFVSDGENFWRIYTFIDGRNFETAKTPEIAFEAGRLLGKYHRVLNTDFHHTFKHFRPMKHNIPLLYKKFIGVIEKKSNPAVDSMIPIIKKMLDYDLPKDLRKLVGHGDTKITNFIFTETQPWRAKVIVDFDDVGNHSTLLYELGSAFRSWCSQQNYGTYSFSLKHFRSAFHGHYTGSGDILNTQEKELIPQGIKIQCLQLASRFVRDFFEQSYFQYDPKKFKSPQEHSVIRAKECIDLFIDVNNKEEEILSIVEHVAKLS